MPRTLSGLSSAEFDDISCTALVATDAHIRDLDIVGTFTTTSVNANAFGKLGADPAVCTNLDLRNPNNQVFVAGANITLGVDGSGHRTLTSTDTNTTYSAGTNVTINGTTISSTDTNTDTTYTAGTGLTLGGTRFSLNLSVALIQALTFPAENAVSSGALCQDSNGFIKFKP